MFVLTFYIFLSRYKGPLLEEQALIKAAEGGLSSPEFSELCVWLGSQIKSLCNLEESITSAGIAIEFYLLFCLLVKWNDRLWFTVLSIMCSLYKEKSLLQTTSICDLNIFGLNFILTNPKLVLKFI